MTNTNAIALFLVVIVVFSHPSGAKQAFVVSSFSQGQRGNSYPVAVSGTRRRKTTRNNRNLGRLQPPRTRATLDLPLSTSRNNPSYNNNNNNKEDIYAAVHRKEYEIKQLYGIHKSTTDPVRMAMSYAQESPSSMRLAKALRRVYEDVNNPANPNHHEQQQKNNNNNNNMNEKQKQRAKQFQEYGLVEMGMRRASFLVDIKRYSRQGRFPNENYCSFDDAGLVAEAMVRLGADAVLINTDFPAYGGDMTELKSAVRLVRRASPNAAVVMKDIVVDELQLGLAKEAGADGIILMSSVLGATLEQFLDLATTIGLETIVECHTKDEVERALELLAPNIMVNNYDRITQSYYPKQAIQLAGLFPGSGGRIICLATGGIDTTESMKQHLAVGYDGVVVGRAAMGSPRAPEFIRAVRDRTLLPAELSSWGLEQVEFDPEGNVMPGRPETPASRGDDDGEDGNAPSYQ